MKITIDTKEDSHEEIRKLIKMLQHLVGEHPVTNQPDIFKEPDSFGTSSDQETNTAAEGNVFGNIFDAPSSSTETQEITGTNETEERKEDEPEEEKEDVPEVIPY